MQRRGRILGAGGIAATAIAVVAIAVGGGGSPPPPVGNANLWVVASGAGTCTRAATPTTFNSSTSCTFTNALNNSAAGDTVLVRDGSYSGLGGITTVKSSNVTFKAENPGGATTSSITATGGKNLTFENLTINGNTGCGDPGDCNNITFKNNQINGTGIANSGVPFNHNITWDGNVIDNSATSCSSADDCDTMQAWGNTEGFKVVNNLIIGHVKTATGHTDFFQACGACDGGSRGDGISFVGNWFIQGFGNQGVFIKDGTYTNCEASDNLMVNIPNINSGTATAIQIYPCTPDASKPLYTGFGVKMDHNTMVNESSPITRDCPATGNYRVQYNVFDELRMQADASSCNYATWIPSQVYPNSGHNVLKNTGQYQAQTSAGDTTASPIFVNANGSTGQTGNYSLAPGSPGYNVDPNLRSGITWDPTTKVFGPR